MGSSTTNSKTESTTWDEIGNRLNSFSTSNRIELKSYLPPRQRFKLDDYHFSITFAVILCAGCNNLRSLWTWAVQHQSSFTIGDVHFLDVPFFIRCFNYPRSSMDFFQIRKGSGRCGYSTFEVFFPDLWGNDLTHIFRMGGSTTN